MRKPRGSLTLETAIVLPVFLSLAISLISILEMMNLYARVEYALHETAREMAVMEYPAEYIKTAGAEYFESVKSNTFRNIGQSIVYRAVRIGAS